MTFTNANGYYRFTDVAQSTMSYTITPLKSPYFFNPDSTRILSLSANLYDINFIGSYDIDELQDIVEGEMRVVISSVVITAIHPSQTARVEFKGYSVGTYRLRVFDRSGIVIEEQNSQPLNEGFFSWSPTGCNPGKHYLLIKGPNMFVYKPIDVLSD